MKNMKLLFVFLFSVVLFSCTKLDEEFNSELEENNSATITADQLLTSAYNGLNGPFQTGDFWHIQEHTSDELIAPTRGPDWDDNGQWRALHAHTWNADQGQIRGAFNGLLGIQFSASNVLQFNPSAQQAAEARFIRALSMFATLDGYDQVPYREDLSDYKKLPETLQGTACADFIIAELNDIMGDLPSTGPAYVANQDAAKVLLMKLYLNKGVYANRASPSFDAADMTQVITLADQIISSNKYSLDDNYYDNFAPNNSDISSENIFTLYNQNGDRGGGVQNTTYQINHYNMNPSGWNGFATLSDFYDKFESTDKRLGTDYDYPGALPNPGNRRVVGFLIGQQYNLTTDEALEDRKGNALSFTREVALRETGNNLEITGIRVNKYPFDYGSSGDQKNNDWALFRYADVLLMKAEAELRSGAGDAKTIINDIRNKRGATALTADPTLQDVLDERGRELYWEGWRRQDLIRFGKFLEPWQEKESDDPKNLVFPIPSDQLAVNPTLTQNPCY